MNVKVIKRLINLTDKCQKSMLVINLTVILESISKYSGTRQKNSAN